MMRRRLPSLLLLCGVLPALAAPYDSGTEGASEVLLRAMKDEMRRTVERLRLATEANRDEIKAHGFCSARRRGAATAVLSNPTDETLAVELTLLINKRSVPACNLSLPPLDIRFLLL